MVIVEVDVLEQFTNSQEFTVCEHMLQWTRVEAEKLQFGVVIGRFENDYDRKKHF